MSRAFNPLKILGVICATAFMAISPASSQTLAGGFNTNLGSTAALQPGQTFVVTLTASTNSTTGVIFSQAFALNPNVGSQFQLAPGGTCTVAALYTNGQSCTVLVRFLGTAPGAFTSLLLGACAITSGAGGFAIDCATGVAGQLGAFSGNGAAAAVATVVDTLGRNGFATLLLTMLGLGAIYSLRSARQS